MSRYTLDTRNGLVHLIDSTTGHVVFTGGDPREAARLLKALHRARPAVEARRRRYARAATAGLLGLLGPNKAAHPDILAARAATPTA